VSSTRFLYDTGIFLYATGAEHPYRDACRAMVRLAADGILLGDASVELVQEYVHVRAHRSGDHVEAVRGGQYISQLCRLHALQPEDMSLGLKLFEESPKLQMRDAVHAATALNRGIRFVVTPDRAFDEVQGLERVDPLGAPDRLLTS
jgi:uncharacterized protein